MPRRQRSASTRPTTARTAQGEISAAPDVVWRAGVHLTDTVIWCDAGRARDLMFLSHAHLRSRGAHRKILTSPRTLTLLAAAGARPVGETLVTPFGRPFSLGGLRLELYPSGHVPGAASLLLTRADGRRIAYAGDVNPVASLAEPAEVRGADALVLDAPLASLGVSLPPRAEVIAQLALLVENALAAKKTPVIFAPALGASQEVIVALGQRGLLLRAHPRIHQLTAACAVTGSIIGPLARYGGRVQPGEALLWPLELRDAKVLGRHAGGLVRIALTGLALDAAARAALDVEHALPLSDHGDLDAVSAYALHTGARDVYLLSPGVLASRLVAHGLRVHQLGAPRQMDLFEAAGGSSSSP